MGANVGWGPDAPHIAVGQWPRHNEAFKFFHPHSRRLPSVRRSRAQFFSTCILTCFTSAFLAGSETGNT